MRNYIFFLALTTSIIIHLFIVFAGLIPALRKKSSNINKPISVELRSLSLDNKRIYQPQNIIYPQQPAKKASPKTNPRQNTSSNSFKLISANKHKSRLQKTKNVLPKINLSKSELPIQKKSAVSEASQPQNEIFTVQKSPKIALVTQQNYREKTNGHKLHGARDAYGMIVSSQNKKNLPTSAKLSYLEENFGLPCNMLWQRQNGKYELSLLIKIPFRRIEYRTNGLIDKKHGLRPLFFQEIRNGKTYRSVKFNWNSHRLEFNDNGKNSSAELKNGAQDLLSLSWQLALKGAHLDGDTQITNGRKVYNYPIRPGNGAILDVDNGSIRAEVIQARYDTDEVELWLAPDFANTPIRIIFKKPSEPKLDLQIISININDIDEWQRPDKHMSHREK